MACAPSAAVSSPGWKIAILRFRQQAKKALATATGSDSAGGMIRGGFLDPGTRQELITLVRDGKAEMRLGRRANALLLLNDGLSWLQRQTMRVDRCATRRAEEVGGGNVAADDLNGWGMDREVLWHLLYPLSSGQAS